SSSSSGSGGASSRGASSSGASSSGSRRQSGGVSQSERDSMRAARWSSASGGQALPQEEVLQDRPDGGVRGRDAARQSGPGSGGASSRGASSSGASSSGSRQQSGGVSQSKQDSMRASSSSSSSSDQALPQHEELQNRPDVGMRGRNTGRSSDEGMR